MTKQEELQKLVDEACERNSGYYHFHVEFRGGAGWWAVPEESRWFGDAGEYLGANFSAAKKTLSIILPC
jgi:hypothetical protein